MKNKGAVAFLQADRSVVRQSLCLLLVQADILKEELAKSCKRHLSSTVCCETPGSASNYAVVQDACTHPVTTVFQMLSFLYRQLRFRFLFFVASASVQYATAAWFRLRSCTQHLLTGLKFAFATNHSSYRL